LTPTASGYEDAWAAITGEHWYPVHEGGCRMRDVAALRGSYNYGKGWGYLAMGKFAEASDALK
jgi:hypothetical protein